MFTLDVINPYKISSGNIYYNLIAAPDDEDDSRETGAT